MPRGRSPTPSCPDARQKPTALTVRATLLLDGRVLIAGGTVQPGFGASVVTNRADLYDPVTGTLSPTAEPMEAPRLWHGAALLESGRVLLVCGTSSAAVNSQRGDLRPGDRAVVRSLRRAARGRR